MTPTLTPPAPPAAAAPAVPVTPTAVPVLARSMSIRLNERVTIPASVVDFASFREWRKSDDYPEKLRTHWIEGALWVDLDTEQLHTHGRVRNIICSVLMPLADNLGTGE
ncbi:MAG: hypothetical protein K2W96_09605 [Gemmataceae bacterium]|nr:hypothetical protein [Gemmataceae bacterium]